LPGSGRARAMKTHVAAAPALVLLLVALAAWSEWAVGIDGAEAVSMAALYEAAAPVIDDYESALRPCQIDAERGRQDGLEAILRDLVRERLRTLEAKRLGITAETLQARIDDAAEPVTDADVSAFHREAGIAQPLAEIAPQIPAYLANEAIENARAVAYGDMERRYLVAYLLEPLRYEVAADGFPSYGPADAPVTIVEFSDFECFCCARLLPTLDEVKRQYDDRVRVVYRHYPLTSMHPHAWKAAEAALCAGEQGRFWELHDLMFVEQEALTVDDLKAKAARLALGGEVFGRCLDSGRLHDAVAADVAAGDAVGVSGTPTLFVNGRFVGVAVPFAALAAIIDDVLQRAMPRKDRFTFII